MARSPGSLPTGCYSLFTSREQWEGLGFHALRSIKLNWILIFFFKKAKKDILGKLGTFEYRLGFQLYWGIINFLRCKSSIVAPWEKFLIFRRYTLKHLEVKINDACNFL